MGEVWRFHRSGFKCGDKSGKRSNKPLQQIISKTGETPIPQEFLEKSNRPLYVRQARNSLRQTPLEPTRLVDLFYKLTIIKHDEMQKNPVL